MLVDRARWFRDGRIGPDGDVPWNARNRALAQLERSLRQGLLKSETREIIVDRWAPIGPACRAD